MLELQKVSKYIQRKPIVSEVSFQLKKGSITGLLGPNGAGKTTLIRMINGILEPDEGSVRLEGKLIELEQRNKIGYLPEERGLYKQMTVEAHAEFIGELRGLSKSQRKEQMDFWFGRFEINDWRKKRIESLSKGMAQKVQFICTLLHDPDLLILDEPFTGFDPLNVELITAELHELKTKGKTILVSTHNMRNVEDLCDRAVLINQGKKVAEGTLDELRKVEGEAVYAVRFKGNMLSFVNALWAGFEIVDKKDLGNDRFEVFVTMRHENTFDDLLRVLIGQIKIEAAWLVVPSMQRVFVQTIQTEKLA